MKESDIHFNVQLDENNIPETINWNATDKPDDAESETNAIALSVWDNETKNTLRIDLWTKKMTVEEMKHMAVDTIGGLADTIRTSTQDEKMASMMHEFCQELIKHVNENQKKD